MGSPARDDDVAKRTNGRRPRAGNGRFTEKLTRDTIVAVTTAIRTGDTITAAAALVGISRATLYRWLRAGQNPDGTLLERQFALEVSTALAECESVVAAAFLAGAQKDWRAAESWLERRHPDTWGKVQRVDVDARVEHEHRHTLDLSALSDEELEQLERLHAKALDSASIVDGEVIELPRGDA